eukprot:m.89231 g.89231  ORF g.89231 m.89231 type:complete len:143 (-) comp14571_c1_seq1:53-481(-)
MRLLSCLDKTEILDGINFVLPFSRADNFALTTEECDAFHHPPPTAKVPRTVLNTPCNQDESGDDDDDDETGPPNPPDSNADDDDGTPTNNDDVSGNDNVGNGKSNSSLSGSTSWAVLGTGAGLALVAVVAVVVIFVIRRHNK